MRQVALDLAKRGFRVLPCNPGSKIASLDDWPNASMDALGVAEQWPGEAYNVAIHCRGLAVLDVDVKGGRNGLADLKSLPAIPDTYTVKTPSGGYHLYFRTPEGVEVSNSAKNLPAGIDIRGANGYVLAPGSVVDGKKYEVLSTAPVAPAPEWLLERLRAAPERKAEPGGTIGALDTPAAVERAKAIIAKAAPAIEGERGNDTTYALAARLFPLGLSLDTVFELLQPWNDRCEPPWDDDELTRILENARTYKQEPTGYDNPLHGLEPVPAPPPAPSRLVFPSDVSLDAIRERQEGALIQDLWHRGEFAVIYGDSTAGKSFVALDLAYAIARGEPWHGRQVKQGPVLYVCLEGASGFKLRMAACEVARGKAGRNFAMLPGRLVLSRNAHGDAGLAEILTAAAELEKSAGKPVAAIVIDTLQRAMAGDDENSTSDMAAFVDRIGKIQQRTGAAVVLCHHTNAAGNMRGSTALFASADAILKVAKAPGKRRRVYVEKVKDVEDGYDLFWFDLANVDIGQDSAGVKYTAAVVRRVDAGKVQDAA